jgi:hypothetical protein
VSLKPLHCSAVFTAAAPAVPIKSQGRDDGKPQLRSLSFTGDKAIFKKLFRAEKKNGRQIGSRALVLK